MSSQEISFPEKNSCEGKTAAVILPDQSNLIAKARKAEGNNKIPSEKLFAIINKTGINNIFMAMNLRGYGKIKGLTGHDHLAQIMKIAMKELRRRYDGLLFVPESAFNIHATTLEKLLARKDGAFYAGWSLPAFITRPFSNIEQAGSIQRLFDRLGIYPEEATEDIERDLQTLST